MSGTQNVYFRTCRKLNVPEYRHQHIDECQTVDFFLTFGNNYVWNCYDISNFIHNINSLTCLWFRKPSNFLWCKSFVLFFDLPATINFELISVTLFYSIQLHNLWLLIKEPQIFINLTRECRLLLFSKKKWLKIRSKNLCSNPTFCRTIVLAVEMWMKC